MAKVTEGLVVFIESLEILAKQALETDGMQKK